MPYIKQERRELYRTNILSLINGLSLRSKSDPKVLDGDVSYVIARIGCLLYGHDFFEMNRFVGILDDAKDEFKRRVLYPYEDKKCQENGEVFE